MKNNNNFDDKLTIILLGFIILLIGIALYLFVLKTPIIENYNSNNYILQFYSMNNCDHCNDFKIQWNKIINVNKNTVHIDENHPLYNRLINKFNIQAFPHIQIVDTNKNGELVSVYKKNDRSAESVLNWYNSFL